MFGLFLYFLMGSLLLGGVAGFTELDTTDGETLAITSFACLFFWPLLLVFGGFCLVALGSVKVGKSLRERINSNKKSSSVPSRTKS